MIHARSWHCSAEVIFMKKKAKAPKPAKKEPPLVLEEPPLREEEPAEPKSSGNALKFLALFVLGVIVVGLVYYFFVYSVAHFIPATKIGAEEFKDIFLEANKVYILMDLRGASDTATRTNVMQCGVDFASSSGMGGKNVTPMSIDEDEGCITPDGEQPESYCFSMLRDGITVYVHGGDGGAEYYTNGMVVEVGPEYTLGTCAIKRL